jgi:predicted XRE-type DNA-binding protein
MRDPRHGVAYNARQVFPGYLLMAQTALLLDVVKAALRQRGITYAQVATALKLSESSVKRLFAHKDMPLTRLESICAVMQLELADLFELTQTAQRRLTELTEEQERALVDDPKLLMVGVLVLSHWTVEQILEQYQLSQAQLVGLLTRLDRLKIIDLLPGNRIKVRLARNFAWRKGGPIQGFFEQRVQRQFFESSFLGPGELRLTVHGSLSPRSNAVLQLRMRKLAEELDALAEEDKQLDQQSRAGTTVVLAIRPWELSLFTELRRRKADLRTAPAPVSPGRTAR